MNLTLVGSKELPLDAKSPGASEAQGVNMDRIAKWGWPNVLRLADDRVELLVTLDVGPRVFELSIARWAERLQGVRRPGGHVRRPGMGRARRAPPLDLAGGFDAHLRPRTTGRSRSPPCRAGRRSGRTTRSTALRKEMELTLESGQVHALHRITNTGTTPATLAAWALTVLAPGGVEIIPLPPKRPHPGSPENASSADEYSPNQSLVLWPFTDLSDPRWTFGRRFILLRQDAGVAGPTKIGLLHREGWAAYAVQGCLFVKRSRGSRGARIPTADATSRRSRTRTC